MKLRIKGNSIRLRLTQSEVTRLASSGSVEESVSFGEKTFGYEILAVDASEISADLEVAGIVVKVPSHVIREWSESDLVSIEHQGIPHVLIEKDFACLSERNNEDDSDAFPNPRQEC